MNCSKTLHPCLHLPLAKVHWMKWNMLSWYHYRPLCSFCLNSVAGMAWLLIGHTIARTVFTRLQRVITNSSLWKTNTFLIGKLFSWTALLQHLGSRLQHLCPEPAEQVSHCLDILYTGQGGKTSVLWRQSVFALFFMFVVLCCTLWNRFSAPPTYCMFESPWDNTLGSKSQIAPIVCVCVWASVCLRHQKFSMWILGNWASIAGTATEFKHVTNVCANVLFTRVPS